MASADCDVLERGEIRERVESEIELCDCALRAEMLHLHDETRREMNGIEQAEECAARISAGDDCFRGDFFTGRKNDTSRRAALHQNLFHFSAGADFSARFFCGRG